MAITPIWFLLLETFVFRGDRLSRRGTLGLMLGIAGVAILFWPKFAERQTLGIMQLLAATTPAVLIHELGHRLGVLAQVADEG